MDETVATAALDRWVRSFALLVAENKDLLTDLDAAIGDGDHGANMDRGMRAVLAALDDTPPVTAAALFNKVGMTLVSTVGGASGPLFGTFFLRAGASFGDTAEISAGPARGSIARRPRRDRRSRQGRSRGQDDV